MTTLFEPLTFPRGPTMKNRFMLAPLTNSQSHEDGVLSDGEFHWLTMRAKGGFGLTMTCAAHVQAVGKGFPGQLGVFGDEHIDGLTRLASAIRAENSLAIIQLHHAGMRSPADLIGTSPVCPSADEETGARALTTTEVEALIEDFVVAAERAEKAGFDGVEIHGAHGYIICQFLSASTNRRDDKYGGSAANRARILFDIIDGIRARCRPDFLVGVRLSPERFGLLLDDIVEVAARLMKDDAVDFLDMSLWDVFKEPEEDAHKGRRLVDFFTDLERGNVRLGIAGKIRTPREAEEAMATGVDWIMLGRAAILHHNFPQQMADNVGFEPASLPVTREHLTREGLSPPFITYMSRWPGFVAEEAESA